MLGVVVVYLQIAIGPLGSRRSLALNLPKNGRAFFFGRDVARKYLNSGFQNTFGKQPSSIFSQALPDENLTRACRVMSRPVATFASVARVSVGI